MARRGSRDSADDGLKAFLSEVEQSRKASGASIAEFDFAKERARVICEPKKPGKDGRGVVYWMSRDSRVQDNWAFLYAQRVALEKKVPLQVCFCLIAKYLDASVRQFHFLVKGLEKVAAECESLNIPFHLLEGNGAVALPEWVVEHEVGTVVCDFNPLRVPMGWVDAAKESLPKDVTLIQVDAHNIVPVWVTSDKQEYAARTIRTKIHRNLPKYLTDFPPVIRHPYSVKKREPINIDWDAAIASREADKSVGPVWWAVAGYESGMGILKSFIEERLQFFATERNDPTSNALSNLSPWFHFGQVSVQRAVLCVREKKKTHGTSCGASVDSFLEEAIVRRELSDNFCFYNPLYDSVEGASGWAQETLRVHAKDVREVTYTFEELEKGKTYDDLWNAAQMQLVHEGKLHGFLRMYWCKKILEWSPSPEEALRRAIYMNDHYNIDGRDPNGYVGCMWSICGIHDQGWKERPIFGKIRYMAYDGCKRKFDVKAFVAKYPNTNNQIKHEIKQ